MQFQIHSTDPAKSQTDLLVLFALMGSTPEDTLLTQEGKSIDKILNGEIKEIIKAEGYEAGIGNMLLLYTRGAIGARRVLVVGVGKLGELSMYDWQTIAATVARKAKSIHASSVSVGLSGELLDVFGVKESAQGWVEGIILGVYTFLKHKDEAARKKDHAIETVTVLVPAEQLELATKGIQDGEVVAEAVGFARDLVNEPPSMATPTYLASTATKLAEGHSKISCEILAKKEMKALGMGGILGIARGSDEEPKFITLSYKGGGNKTIALIGKGITFDTGGLSLKPSQSMETMKQDMAGAAAILGVFYALSVLAPKIHVVGLIAATENMPSGNAIKPGDVVRAMNGKTIEVLNTDAEGRMVLCDALSYAAEKVKPSVMIDVATLTGACVVALGEEIAGLFANTQELAEALKRSGTSTGEKIWELPLPKEYKEFLKSPIADLKNIGGGRWGGAITGALFLEEFVPKGTPWAHLDIAGPAFAEKDAPLTPYGGTGFGVRLLLDYLLSSA